jgi:hypothetical protein
MPFITGMLMSTKAASASDHLSYSSASTGLLNVATTWTPSLDAQPVQHAHQIFH